MDSPEIRYGDVLRRGTIDPTLWQRMASLAVSLGGEAQEEPSEAVMTTEASLASLATANASVSETAEEARPPILASMADFYIFAGVDPQSRQATTIARYWHTLVRMHRDSREWKTPPFSVEVREFALGRNVPPELEVRSLAGYVAAIDAHLASLIPSHQRLFYQRDMPMGTGKGAVDFWRNFAAAKIAEADASQDA